jgi:hypothetical protein
MSTSRLQKYLDRPVQFNNAGRKLVLLSDSKGRYLSPFIDPGYSIKIISKSGCALSEGFHWLVRNIDRLIACHGPLTLCVWLGTCDFTSKAGRILTLRHESDEKCFQQITGNINRVFHLLAAYTEVKVIFLEIPPYSLVQWFKSKGLEAPYDLHAQDLLLAERIDLVNEFICQKNEQVGVRSPKFKLDLINYRKSATGGGRRSICFKHYLDGVHPSPLLSRVWLKRLLERFYCS